MSSASRPCTPANPMYCKRDALARLYRESRSVFPAENLINSPQTEIMDGINWSFDPASLTIWNNRYWKGFYPADYDFTNLVLMYGFGFFKRFWPDKDQSKGVKVRGETHPFLSDIHAANQALDMEIPEIGKAIYIKYGDFPYNNFDDVIKIIDKDIALGEAFVSLRKPGRGLPVFHFVLSRKYSLDFMTQADCRFIFQHKAKAVQVGEVLGCWDLLLVSDAALSPPILRFYFLEEKGIAGSGLRAEFVQGGKISHAGHSVSFAEDALMSINLPAQAEREALRMVNKDLLLGMLDLSGHPLKKALDDFSGFMTTAEDPDGQSGHGVQKEQKDKRERKDRDAFILPYVLKRSS
ncbi:MAG TPA: hypothetical protein PKK11_06840 [Methanothrix sp.]|nr:hypothetical protein [Methanothrix sp.]